MKAASKILPSPLHERVMALLLARAKKGQGMPSQREMGQALDVESWSVSTALERLRRDGRLERIAPGTGRAATACYRIVDTGQILPSRPTAFEAAGAESDRRIRRCLSCLRDFLSQHRGNRICEACGSHRHAQLEAYHFGPVDGYGSKSFGRRGA